MRVASSDGVELELYDLGGAGSDLLVAHATGMCAGAYRPLAARLAETHHVWAFDFRAHGRSTAPSSGDLDWRAMAGDVLAVVDAIGSGPIRAFGHSMGGACLARAELERPGTLHRAVLFEPIIVPPAFGLGPGGNPLAEAARHRRPGFATRAEALARYAGRPPLGLWRADALAAYVEDGFVDVADGTVTLACTPEHEAATFEAAGKPLISEMAGVATPVLVMCGGRDPNPGPADFAPAVAAALPSGAVSRHPNVGHFGPFQDPDSIAEDTAAFLAGT